MTAEYVITVATAGLLFVVALVFIGPGLVEHYQETRDVIAAPYP